MAPRSLMAWLTVVTKTAAVNLRFTVCPRVTGPQALVALKGPGTEGLDAGLEPSNGERGRVDNLLNRDCRVPDPKRTLTCPRGSG